MDPLAEKYYSSSPYAFCGNNPVNFVDLDGLTPRLYIQKSGLGHAFVTTGEGNNTIVYTYGRYGALRERSGSNSGMFTPKGEGVLFRLDSEMAVQYLSDVRDEGNVDIYQISNGNDQAISEYFDQLFVAGTPPTEPTKNSWNNPSAKVIDTYSLFNNNCVTMSLKGVNSSSQIIDSKAISPRHLARYMNKESQKNSDIIKVENSLDFIHNILELLSNDTSVQ